MLYNDPAAWDRAGKRSATWLTTKYYTFNGQRIAMRDETGLTYLHADQLGSTALTTNGSGTTLDDHGYYAYGKDRRGSELHTTQRFTGQQGDATGLLYYGARYYDPQLGQFISPDTLVPDASNLFDYNRYMYARGNPMKYNDPTGHSGVLPCLVCNRQWLDYSQTPDAVDGVADVVATVACFVAGCHVDHEKDTITGPTNKEYVEQSISLMMGAGLTPLETPGLLQERTLREALSKTYDQVYGSTDAEIRRGLGITGKTADFLGYEAQQGRWLIAESKGGDLDKAFKQLTNTANGLINKVPDAASKLDLRIYMNQIQYDKLVQGDLSGWRVQHGLLGWTDEAGKWVHATVNGARILVQAAK